MVLYKSTIKYQNFLLLMERDPRLPKVKPPCNSRRRLRNRRDCNVYIAQIAVLLAKGPASHVTACDEKLAYFPVGLNRLVSRQLIEMSRLAYRLAFKKDMTWSNAFMTAGFSIFASNECSPFGMVMSSVVMPAFDSAFCMFTDS